MYLFQLNSNSIYCILYLTSHPETNLHSEERKKKTILYMHGGIDIVLRSLILLNPITCALKIGIDYLYHFHGLEGALKDVEGDCKDGEGDWKDGDFFFFLLENEKNRKILDFFFFFNICTSENESDSLRIGSFTFVLCLS